MVNLLLSILGSMAMDDGWTFVHTKILEIVKV